MLDLYTPRTRTANELKLKYEGKAVSPKECLACPMVIHHYEFTKSRFNEGRYLLVAQISYWKNTENALIEKAVLMTEGTSLCKTMRLVESKGITGPFQTKIIRTRKDMIMMFVKLNKPEILKLQGSYDPCPPEGRIGWLDVDGATPFDLG